MKHTIDYQHEIITIINIIPIEIKERSWLCIAFEEKNMGDYMHFAFVYREDYPMGHNLLEHTEDMLKGSLPVLRIHSECFLGDAISSSLCDCGEQLQKSIDFIMESGSGILIYLRQEGRGIGMRAKLSCLALQEGYYRGIQNNRAYGTYEANYILGYEGDERKYDSLPSILDFLRVKAVRLISGNPEKIQALTENGVEIAEIIDIDRKDIDKNSRKGRELLEKKNRDYKYKNIRYRGNEHEKSDNYNTM